MTTKRLTERFSLSAGKVDRTGARPVLRDVLLCGGKSANRRRYLGESFGDAGIAKYDGVDVYLNHSDGRAARRYEDRIGRVRNPRRNSAGRPIGDIEINGKHPFAEALLDDAENNPTSVGMSHVAHCKTRTARDGWEEVESIERVESVDIVLDPATTKGLWSESNKGKAVPFTIKQVAGWVAKHAESTSAQTLAAKRLAEMDGMADVAAMDAPPAEEMDPADGVKDAFKAAIAHIVEQSMSGEMDPKEAIAKIKKLMASHGEINGGAPAADAAGDDSDADDDAAEESKKKGKKADPYAVLAECRKAGYDPTALELKFLGTLAPEDRAVYLTEQRQKSADAKAQQPSGASRRPGPGGTAGAGKKVEEAVPADAKSFAASIRE